MPVTHILVDFENTQPLAADVARVPAAGVKLWIFRGPSQKKYDAEFAEALLSLGERVAIVRCEKSGRNALDMHIAFQMGRLVGELARASAPSDTAFVVVSRDTDYDPLLAYVRAQGFKADRVAGLTAALGDTVQKPAPAKGSKAKAATPSSSKGAAPQAAGPARQPAAAKATKTAATKAAKNASAAAAPASGALSIEAAADKIVEHFRDHPRSRPARRAALEKWLASHLRGRLADGQLAELVATLQARGVLSFEATKVNYML